MAFDEKDDNARPEAAHIQDTAHHHDNVKTETREVTTASVALAAAVAEQKPNIWSKNMIKLYGIMGVGYLVSTMNGFGTVSAYTYTTIQYI